MKTAETDSKLPNRCGTYARAIPELQHERSVHEQRKKVTDILCRRRNLNNREDDHDQH